jgi:hypothetical protein
MFKNLYIIFIGVSFFSNVLAQEMKTIGNVKGLDSENA